MSEPPFEDSESVAEIPTDEPVVMPTPERVKPDVFPFGLSAEQFAKVRRKMLAVARKVCGHSDASPGDAVQQAFVKALLKPDAERLSIHDEKKFVAWLCTLAKYEALTNRQSSRRRAQREVVPEHDVADLAGIAPAVGAVEARKMLQGAFMTLEPEDQALLHALYVEGKTIDSLAAGQEDRRKDLQARHRRLLKRLHASILAAVAALVLQVPRKARAFVAHAKQRLMQVLPSGSALTVTVMFGALVPASSSVTTEPALPASLARLSTSPTALAQLALQAPSFDLVVAPEEPNVLDAVTNECSAGGMNSNNIARRFRETLVPLSFWVAPVLTQVACTGAEQQTPPPQQPVTDPDGFPDPYVVACQQERMWGNKCPSREDWEKIGVPK